MENIDEKKNAWLAERKKYTTGTDAACLLGLSPWGNPLTVYLDKKGLGEPVVENEAMKWGLRLEAEILKAYAETMKCRLVNVDGYDLKTNDDYPHLACSLDGWNMDLGIPVDAKNIRFCDASRWGESGTDEFPAHYKTQLQVQMMVMNAKMAHLAVLFSGQDFRVYQMQYDEELAEQIVNASDEFFGKYMVEGGSEEPPMPSPDVNSTDTIKKILERGVKDKKVEANDEIRKVAKTLARVKERKKEVTDLESVLSNKIKLFMSDATICEGVCTWKNNKDSVTTDYDGIAKYLLDSKCTPEEREDIVGRFTSTVAGNRVLRLTIAK